MIEKLKKKGGTQGWV